MEHISLVTPNFIIAPPQPGCPHSQCHLIRGKSLLLRRSVTRDLLIPGCVGIRDQDSPGHKWRPKHSLSRHSSDKNIYEGTNNYNVFFCELFLMGRGAITGQWTLCHALYQNKLEAE